MDQLKLAFAILACVWGYLVLNWFANEPVNWFYAHFWLAICILVKTIQEIGEKK